MGSADADIRGAPAGSKEGAVCPRGAGLHSRSKLVVAERPGTPSASMSSRSQPQRRAAAAVTSKAHSDADRLSLGIARGGTSRRGSEGDGRGGAGQVTAPPGKTGNWCINITRHATRSPGDRPTPAGQSSNGEKVRREVRRERHESQSKGSPHTRTNQERSPVPMLPEPPMP